MGVVINMMSRVYIGCEIGSVAVVVPEVLPRLSDISVFVVSSLSLSISFGSTAVQHESSLGLFKLKVVHYMFICKANKPADGNWNKRVVNLRR